MQLAESASLTHVCYAFAPAPASVSEIFGFDPYESSVRAPDTIALRNTMKATVRYSTGVYGTGENVPSYSVTVVEPTSDGLITIRLNFEEPVRGIAVGMS